MSISRYLIFCTGILVLSCGERPADQQDGTFDKEGTESQAPPEKPLPYPFPYRLNDPDDTFLLSHDLVEISGLGLSDDGMHLLAVNDEDGYIFYLQPDNGEVAKRLKFSGPGDYEGIEMVDGTIFVVRSDGALFEVVNPGQEDQNPLIHKTFLTSEQDVEGLCHDPATGHLLLACKGKAGKGKDFKGKRAVYAFDLAAKLLLPEPRFLIDREDLLLWAQEGHYSITRKFAEAFEPGLAADAFAPSGIAVHPLSKDYYILSSTGKKLVVLNTNGELLHIEPLAPSLHRKPEGICFFPDGTLFISNEGKGGSAKLMRFGMRG